MSKRKLETSSRQQKSFFFGQPTGIEKDNSIGNDAKALGVQMASTSVSDSTLKAKTPYRTYHKPFVHDWLSPTNLQYLSWLTYDK